MAFAVVIVLLVIGTVDFHISQAIGGPWYFTEIAIVLKAYD